MRIDKFISNLWYASRKEIAKYIKNWYILVNDNPIFEKDFTIQFWDKIHIGTDIIEYKEYIYVLLHKTLWYVSSKKPEWKHPSYLDLMHDCPYSQIIDIVGRLDVDTSGLVLLTNNGALTHKIISPKKEIFKKYYVKTKFPLSQNDRNKLISWVKIDDIVTQPAKVEYIDDNSIYLSISEWKFHQIKKMMESIKNEVIELHRVSIWNLELGNLPAGKWRYLEEYEIQWLLEKN